MSQRWLLRSLVLVVLAFVGATVVLVRMRGVDKRVEDLLTNSLPSVARLMTARVEVDEIASFARAARDAPEQARGHVVADVLREEAALDEEVRLYAQLPWYPGELEEYQASLVPELAALRGAIQTFVASMQEGPPSAWDAIQGTQAAASEEVRAACEAVDGTLLSLARLNHAYAHQATLEIASTRARSLRLALGTGAAAAVLALLAAVASYRMNRRYDRLVAARQQLLRERADELEMFGHRVAHDLVSPLAAVGYAIASLARRNPDPANTVLTRRAQHSLQRSRELVTALFDFAASGAVAVPDARAELRAAVDGAVDAHLAADPRSPPVTVEAFEPCEVRCTAGALASILSNLLSNASKHTIDAPERRITVRAAVLLDRARVEVEDTGAGIPAEAREALFEPYARGAGTRQPGLGLGLATVKRFVVAYGGTVGVRPGKVGSIFWFELARAPAADTSSFAARAAAPSPSP